jgi:hypothetical protein
MYLIREYQEILVTPQLYSIIPRLLEYNSHSQHLESIILVFITEATYIARKEAVVGLKVS